jgi:Domain of Unknown Function (DUF1259)
MKRTCLFFLLLLCLYIASAAAQQNASWKPIDDAMGRQGQDQPDGTHRFGMPRSDLKVTANGVELKAGFALGSWAAFRNMGNHMDVMGDLVLTESEVGPVMQKLVDSGIAITAVHNHLLGESPQIMYMHIHGMGEGPKLASALRDALAVTKTPASAPPRAQIRILDLIPNSWTALWDMRAGTMAVYTNTQFHAQRRSPRTVWRSRIRWASRQLLISSRPVEGRQQLLEILS